jgi:hypothetical protein
MGGLCIEISEIDPIITSDKCCRNPSNKDFKYRQFSLDSPKAIKYASTNGPINHAQTVPW